MQLYLEDTKRKHKMYYAFTIVNDTIQKDLKKNECYKRTSFYSDWLDDLKELLKINVRSGKYYNFLYPALYDQQTFDGKTEEDFINDTKTIWEKRTFMEYIKTNIENNKEVEEELVRQGAF